MGFGAQHWVSGTATPSHLRLWSRLWAHRVDHAALGNSPLLNEIHPKPCYPANTGGPHS